MVTKSKLILEYHTCPRCQGRLSLERDEFGHYEECIFCGFTKDLEPMTKSEKQDWSEHLKENQTK